MTPLPSNYQPTLTIEQVETQATRLAEFLAGLTYIDRIRVIDFLLLDALLHIPDLHYREGARQAIVQALGGK